MQKIILRFLRFLCFKLNPNCNNSHTKHSPMWLHLSYFFKNWHFFSLMFLKHLCFALILLIGAFQFGYILGYPSPVVPALQKEWHLTDTQTTFFNSVSSLSAIPGPFLSHFILHFAGRKKAMFIIAVAGTIAWGLLLLMNAERFVLGIVIRGLLGVVMGAYSSITPLYIVEIAPEGKSASFGTLNNLGIATGLFVLYILGDYLDWFKLTIIGSAICGAQCLLIWLVPESPASQNQEESTKERLFQQKYTKGLVVGIALMFFQQFCGINAILTNLGTLLTSAGVKTSPGIASAIACSAQMITIFLSSFFVAKFGRKPAWCISAGGIVVFLLVYGFSVKFNWGKIAPVAAIFGFLFFFGMGTGPVAWYIVPELFPGSVRSAATSVASASNWLCAFAVIQLFPTLDKAIGTFWSICIFAIISSCSLVFGLIYVSEPRSVNESIYDSLN